MHSRSRFRTSSLIWNVQLRPMFGRWQISRPTVTGSSNFIPVISAFLIWQRSDRLRQAELRGSWSGLPLVLAGLALGVDGVADYIRTIGLYRKTFFASLPTGNPQGLKAPLAPMLRAAMDNAQVSAEIYTGPWTDVGTPERLARLNET